MKLTSQMQLIFAKNKDFMSSEDRAAWYQHKDKIHFAASSSFPHCVSWTTDVILISQGLKECVACHELQQMLAKWMNEEATEWGEENKPISCACLMIKARCLHVWNCPWKLFH